MDATQLEEEKRNDREWEAGDFCAGSYTRTFRLPAEDVRDTLGELLDLSSGEDRDEDGKYIPGTFTFWK